MRPPGWAPPPAASVRRATSPWARVAVGRMVLGAGPFDSGPAVPTHGESARQGRGRGAHASQRGWSGPCPAPL